MDKKLSISAIVLFLLLAMCGTTQSAVFNIKSFGAPNGDITQAFLQAWKAACGSPTASKILIPVGSYNMNAVDVKGPCKAPIEIQVDGIIRAPANPAAMRGADQWVKIGYVDFITISGRGVFDGQGAMAWQQNNCGKNFNCKLLTMNFGFNFLKHVLVTGITSKDSKHFHVNVLGCTNFTFNHFTVSAPTTSLNTDGIHIGRSDGVRVLNSNIRTGDDCVSLGDGSKRVTVQNVNCGPGHGISVGSLGRYPKEDPVEHLIVKNCTLRNTTNGVRIKSWPSGPGNTTVTDMHFEDITMIDVMNPIIIDQEYCPWNQCSKKSPSKVKIRGVTFKNIRGTSTTKEGVIIVCSSGVPCQGVELNNVALKFNGAPAIAKCANVRPIVRGQAPTCAA